MPDLLRSSIRPLTGAGDDYDALLALIGEARVVLLGEASHGTREFYRERARITRRLIEEKGFTVVAVEADWPDAYRVNRWVRGVGDDRGALQALDSFERFPRWMWRNREVLEFVQWLREHNDNTAGTRTGFYGLDLYSLHTSIAAVIEFLDRVDPEAARRARYRYACFDHFGEDSQAYGYAAEFGLTPSCERDVVQQLVDLQHRAGELSRRDDRLPEDEVFHAEQNARLVRDAEEYYRTMFRGRVESWNVRDRHMADTLDALLEYFDHKQPRARAVVWAHNSHIGDARATEMGQSGEWNIGQLARERHGNEVLLVGFTTFSGTVTCASDWDQPVEVKRVRNGLPGSFEALFHTLEYSNFLLTMRDERVTQETLSAARLERAIGVVYRPETERVSHYFKARLPDQFDAVLHFDGTEAVEPLDLVSGWARSKDAPETYPAGV